MTTDEQQGFRVLLVGAGEQGWESLGPALQQLSDRGVVLAGIADPDGRQLAWTAKRLGVTATYGSLTEALRAESEAGRPVDGVVIAAPTHLHKQLVLEAIAAGCHVFVEKPPALTADDLREMIDAAAAANVVLWVDYEYLWLHPGLRDLRTQGYFDEVFRAAAEWLRAGPIMSRPSFWNREELGVRLDLPPHLLSLILFGIRSKPTRVSAQVWDRFGRRAYGPAFAAHDTIQITIQFEGGQRADLVATWDGNFPEEESIKVIFHGVPQSIYVRGIGRELDVEEFKLTVLQRVGDARLRSTLEQPLPVQTEDTFPLILGAWVDAARDPEQGRELAEEILEIALGIQLILDAALASALRNSDWQDLGD